IDRLFNEGNDVGQEPSVERNDDILEETIGKDASEVVAEKTEKKRKRRVVRDASGSSYPPKKLRDDYQSLPPNTGGKSLTALSSMISEGSGIPSGATEPLIGASVASMADVGPVDSISGLNLWTRPPYVRYVVSSDGSHHSSSYSEATSFVRSLVADAPVVTVVVTTTVDADVVVVPGSKARDASKDFKNIGDSASAGGVYADAANISKLKKPSNSLDSFYTSQSLNTETMHRVYVPRWKVKNDSILEDPYVCRDLTDRVSWGRAADAAKDSELKDLKERNFTLEGERGVMSEKIVTLESANVAKETELASLSSQVAKITFDLSGFQLSRDELNSKVSSLESERDYLITQKSSLESVVELFRERIEALQDEQAKALGDRVAELDAQLSEMAIHLDEEFYPRFLTTISGRRWFLSHGLKLDGLKVGIDHGKAGRDLSAIEAYDPSAEEKYVDVVNSLGAVDFSLLSELESKKDSSIVDLMDSLRLEGALAEIPEAEDLQPSPEQLMLPIHRPEDNVIFTETSLSSSLEVVNLRVQRFRDEVKEKRLSLTDVMTPFVEPLSSKSLTGEASTSAAPITTVLTTFASSAVIPPSSVVSDQVLDAEPHNEDPPVVTFEKEKLGTSPE
ncbi:hypothetical protein Tco_1251554, partial [Tanacetum coccineum]